MLLVSGILSIVPTFINSCSDRDSAHHYWMPSIDDSSSIIVNGPYLVRNATVINDTLSIHADFNKPTTVEIIGTPRDCTRIRINGVETTFQTNIELSILIDVPYEVPKLDLPDLKDLDWSSIDSLPELSSNYDDSKWMPASNPSSDNSYQRLRTPTSLFASDYGFNAGVLVYRGHFVAKGTEDSFKIHTQGGSAYGHSIWCKYKNQATSFINFRL